MYIHRIQGFFRPHKVESFSHVSRWSSLHYIHRFSKLSLVSLVFDCHCCSPVSWFNFGSDTIQFNYHCRLKNVSIIIEIPWKDNCMYIISDQKQKQVTGAFPVDLIVLALSFAMDSSCCRFSSTCALAPWAIRSILAILL